MALVLATASTASGTLSGTIRAHALGGATKAVAGAQVCVEGTSICASSGTDGSYALSGIAPGAVFVSASAPRYLAAETRQASSVMAGAAITTVDVAHLRQAERRCDVHRRRDVRELPQQLQPRRGRSVARFGALRRHEPYALVKTLGDTIATGVVTQRRRCASATSTRLFPARDLHVRRSMRTIDHTLTMLVLTFGVSAGCGGGQTTSATPDATPADASSRVDAAPPDAAAPDAAPPDAPPPVTLTLSLDPTLDGDTDAVKADSITAADLLDKSGATVGHAAITGDQAVFNLSGVAPGDFFIKVNGDADDLVPTRIDSSTTSVAQRVGQKLRASLIGPADSPVYRINTYSAGQGESPVVKFSDGTPSPDEQPYVFITLKMLTVSFRILGTAAPLTSLSPAVAMHPINNVPIDAWILNTSGQPHHGDAYNDDPTSCQLCHGNPMMKSTSYSAITLTNGWCYRCHYGNGGDASGFVDPTK